VNVLTEIQELLLNKYDVKPELLKPDTPMKELGLDSLSLAELIFDLADRYHVDIGDDQANFKTIGEAAAAIDSMIQA